MCFISFFLSTMLSKIIVPWSSLAIFHYLIRFLVDSLAVVVIKMVVLLRLLYLSSLLLLFSLLGLLQLSARTPLAADYSSSLHINALVHSNSISVLPLLLLSEQMPTPHLLLFEALWLYYYCWMKNHWLEGRQWHDEWLGPGVRLIEDDVMRRGAMMAWKGIDCFMPLWYSLTCRAGTLASRSRRWSSLIAWAKNFKPDGGHWFKYIGT